MPVARLFHFELGMFDLAISVPVPRNFHFDLANFVSIALHFELNNLGDRRRQELVIFAETNFMPVARNFRQKVQFFACST